MATPPAAFSVHHSIAYLRDQFVPFADANVSIGSSPVLYGLSVYTVFGANWDNARQLLQIFRLREHYDRLVTSCRIMGFAPFDEQYSFAQFEAVVQELLARNPAREDVLVRAGVFIDELLPGARITGLRTSLSIYVYPAGELLSRQGIHVSVSSWAKPSDNAIPPRAKVTGAYAAAALAKAEALQNGYDEAIFLDAQGHVAEATIANIFVVQNDEIITPISTGDVLEGITRQSVFELAGALSLRCRAAIVGRTELYSANELFLSGSSARITPVLSVDRRPIGSGRIGGITAKLAALYDAAQHGREPRFRHWLTPGTQSALNYPYEPGRKRHSAALSRNR